MWFPRVRHFVRCSSYWIRLVFAQMMLLLWLSPNFLFTVAGSCCAGVGTVGLIFKVFWSSAELNKSMLRFFVNLMALHTESRRKMIEHIIQASTPAAMITDEMIIKSRNSIEFSTLYFYFSSFLVSRPDKGVVGLHGSLSSDLVEVKCYYSFQIAIK